MRIVSIIIPTYNRSESLVDTLESLLKQRCSQNLNFELIVADNNSKDGTRILVEKYEKLFNGRLQYHFEPRQGRPYALNSAIKKAKGEFIAFIDDDLFLVPDWLEIVWKTFRDDSIKVITGKVIPLWSVKPPSWYSLLIKEPVVDIDHGLDICKVNYALGGNMICRREIFSKLEFPLYRRTQDAAFSRLIRNFGVDIYYVPDLVVYHKMLTNRLTRQYFLKWYFVAGKASSQFDYDHGISFAPWRLKEFIVNMGRLLFNIFNNKRAMYYACRVSYFIGYSFKTVVKSAQI